MQAVLQTTDTGSSLDGAQLVVEFWPVGLRSSAEGASVLALWTAGDCPCADARNVFTFAGRLSPNAQQQRLELAAILGIEPMLCALHQSNTFLAICWSTGRKPTSEDVTGHRRNSARNFERLLVALTVSKPAECATIDCTAYLYQATTGADVEAMIETDPLAASGTWHFEIFAARIIQNRLPVEAQEPAKTFASAKHHKK